MTIPPSGRRGVLGGGLFPPRRGLPPVHVADQALARARHAGRRARDRRCPRGRGFSPRPLTWTILLLLLDLAGLSPSLPHSLLPPSRLHRLLPTPLLLQNLLA